MAIRHRGRMLVVGRLFVSTGVVTLVLGNGWGRDWRTWMGKGGNRAWFAANNVNLYRLHLSPVPVPLSLGSDVCFRSFCVLSSSSEVWGRAFLISPDKVFGLVDVPIFLLGSRFDVVYALILLDDSVMITHFFGKDHYTTDYDLILASWNILNLNSTVEHLYSGIPSPTSSNSV